MLRKLPSKKIENGNVLTVENLLKSTVHSNTEYFDEANINFLTNFSSISLIISVNLNQLLNGC